MGVEDYKLLRNSQHLIAPEEYPGRPQVIPSRGPHEQIYLTDKQVRALVGIGAIYYDEDYGPKAKVYRPYEAADAAKVRSWLV